MRRFTAIVQIVGVIAVIAVGAVILWAVVTGRTVAESQAAEDARLQFELTRANTCAIAGILIVPPEDRTADRAQMIINECLSQVELPFVRIQVPDE